MAKEKVIKKLKQLEKNKFKVSGKKFQGETWFDLLLSREDLEQHLNLFLEVNKDFFDKGSKVKEVVRCIINGKPAIEIQYTTPNYNDVYSVFFGEYCHYCPTISGEFKPSYYFKKDKDGLYHLTNRINLRLADINRDRKINGVDYVENMRQFNQSAKDKINKKLAKKKFMVNLIEELKSYKKVK